MIFYKNIRPSPLLFTVLYASQFLLCVTLLIGFVVPIYSDEVAVHMSRARFLLEDWQILNLFPQCEFKITSSLPVSLAPGAILYSLIYSTNSAFGLRLVGVAVAFIWFAILWWWIGNLSNRPLVRASVRSTFLCLSGIGSLPLILILARAEQMQIVCLAIFCVVPLYLCNRGETVAFAVMKLLGLLLSISLFFYVHPKSIFFIPLVIASCWYSFRFSNLVIRLSALGGLLLLLVQSIPLALFVGSCEGAPKIANILSGNTINLGVLLSDPVGGFYNLIKNIQGALYAIPSRVIFSETPQSGWIASLQMIGPWKGYLYIFNRVVYNIYFYFFVVVSVMTSVFSVLAVFNKELRMHGILCFMILLGVLGHAAIYNVSTWHFYTPGLIVPSMLMLALLVLSALLPRVRDSGTAVFLFVAFSCSAVFFVSSFFLFRFQVPELYAAVNVNSYTISDQALSTPIYSSTLLENNLDMLASRCSIQKSQSARLVVDGASYFMLIGKKEPMNALYVLDYGYGNTTGDLSVFLKRMRSGGILARCDYMPNSLEFFVLKSGDMCCFSTVDLY